MLSVRPAMQRIPSTNAILSIRHTPEGVTLAERALPSTAWTFFGILLTMLLTILFHQFLPLFMSSGAIHPFWISNTWWIILTLGCIMTIAPYLRLFRKQRVFALAEPAAVVLPLDALTFPRENVAGAFTLRQIVDESDGTSVRVAFVLVEIPTQDPTPRLHTFLHPFTSYAHRRLQRWCEDSDITYFGECSVEDKGGSSYASNRYARQWIIDKLSPHDE